MPVLLLVLPALPDVVDAVAPPDPVVLAVPDVPPL
jgi:hypothetical protein